MSLILKNEQHTFIFSLSLTSLDSDKDELIVLATNTRDFYYEKINDEDEIVNKIDTESSVRINMKKIVKFFKKKPESYVIKLDNENDILHLVFEYEIKSSQRVIDTIRINFNLKKCTSPEEIGRYFFCGLLMSLVEKHRKDKPQKSTKQSFNIDNLLNNDEDIQDLNKIIGIETDNKMELKNEVTEIKSELPEEENVAQETKASKMRFLKRKAVEKDFEYDNNNLSQEIEIEKFSKGVIASTSSAIAEPVTNKVSRKINKPTVKF